jgi:D-arabinose 1-dehydrogenase-like Zn-dependent alcohol dehydrogenase
MAEWHPMARWMKTPVILGHEFAGVVSDIGANVSELRSADAIAVESVIWCGRCPAGHAGKTNVCVERRLFGIHEPGGLAEAIRTLRQRENTGDAHFSTFSMARFTT